MIIGDPFKFAFIIDKVAGWSSNNFIQGMFFICLDGKMYPPVIDNTTLSSDIFLFFDKKESPLIKQPNNKELFEKNKLDAFKSCFEITFPSNSDFDNDYRYLCDFTTIINNYCYLFVVSNENIVRILGAAVSHSVLEDNGLDSLMLDNITEVYITKEEIDSIVVDLEQLCIKLNILQLK